MFQSLCGLIRGGPVGLRVFLVAMGVLLLMSTAGEAACIDDALRRVDRDALLMKSNAVYRVVDDWSSVFFWLPLSTVTICDQIDDVGDIYYEIRNHDQNQMVTALRER